MGIVITERQQDGCPTMVMSMDGNRMISLHSKKRTGCRRDASHDLEEYYEVNPLMAQEIFQRSSIYAPMSLELEAFVREMWELAEELDPWYIQDPVEEED